MSVRSAKSHFCAEEASAFLTAFTFAPSLVLPPAMPKT